MGMGEAGLGGMGAAWTELVYVERHLGISMGVRVRAKIIRVVK